MRNDVKRAFVPPATTGTPLISTESAATRDRTEAPGPPGQVFGSRPDEVLRLCAHRRGRPGEKTHFNIIRKISPDTVQGSSWDPESIMPYPFEAGLTREPDKYRNGLTPAGGISARDVQWVKTFYPAAAPAGPSLLLPLQAGQQSAFLIRPAQTRDYESRTFGSADTVEYVLRVRPYYADRSRESGLMYW